MYTCILLLLVDISKAYQGPYLKPAVKDLTKIKCESLISQLIQNLTNKHIPTKFIIIFILLMYFNTIDMIDNQVSCNLIHELSLSFKVTITDKWTQ